MGEQAQSPSAAEYDMRIAPDGTVTSDQGVRGRQAGDLRQSARTSRTTEPTCSPRRCRAAGRAALARLDGAIERSNVKAVVEANDPPDGGAAQLPGVANMISRSDELRSRAISRLADQQA